MKRTLSLLQLAKLFQFSRYACRCLSGEAASNPSKLASCVWVVSSIQVGHDHRFGQPEEPGLRFTSSAPSRLRRLQITAYELFQRLDVPYRVVINEAVELAKKISAEQGHRFINGALDKAACTLRPQEIPD